MIVQGAITIALASVAGVIIGVVMLSRAPMVVVTSTPTVTVTATVRAIVTPVIVPQRQERQERQAPQVRQERDTRDTRQERGAGLTVPVGVSIRYDGCSPTYGCKWSFNYYDVRANTVVLVDRNQSELRKVHELCHAHQALVVGDKFDVTIAGWYNTEEGRSFVAVADAWPWGSEMTVVENSLEDFAETCSWWYVQPGELAELSLVRYNWAKENLP